MMGPITKYLLNDRGGNIFLGILLAAVVIVPIFNLLLPTDSILHIPTYIVSIMGKYLCFALLALALDFVWGYCGILSLGHGAFFALGGYAMGMHLMRQIGSRGVYGNPELPDFMVFLNWKELPWFWYGFDMFWFAMLMVVLVPGLLALVFGWFAFRSRVTGVYFSIITQALTFALMLAFFLNNMGFGGNNGLTDFKELLGYTLQADATRVGLFVISAIALALGYFICRAVTNSKLGRVLVSIRDTENRTRFVGYKVENFKLWAFVLSAVLAGIAGALYVPQVGIINPSEFSPLNSIEMVIWVAIGGRGTLYGAAAGAVVVNLAKTLFTTGEWAEVWLFALGGMFVLVTILLPKGIVGLFHSLVSNDLNCKQFLLTTKRLIINYWRGEGVLGNAVWNVWFVGAIVIWVLSLFPFVIVSWVFSLLLPIYLVYAWVTIWRCAPNSNDVFGRRLAKVIVLLHPPVYAYLLFAM